MERINKLIDISKNHDKPNSDKIYMEDAIIGAFKKLSVDDKESLLKQEGLSLKLASKLKGSEESLKKPDAKGGRD